MPDPPWLTPEANGVLLELFIQPRASRTRVVGEHDGRLKIQLAAPPVDGKANAALLEFLARALGVRKSELELVAGSTGRRKRVRVPGVTLEGVVGALSS